jgi:orotate phosphoribosyltransferase
VTTGLSVREVLGLVRTAGAEVAGIGVVIARGTRLAEGVPFFSLLEMPLVSHEAGDCPQCKDGIPITDPGSRRT